LVKTLNKLLAKLDEDSKQGSEEYRDIEVTALAPVRPIRLSYRVRGAPLPLKAINEAPEAEMKRIVIKS